MIAALYLRVSTIEQTTLNQELELKDYCAKNNITIYKIYRDEGISGAKTSRPELDRMLQDMRKQLFDCLIVWKLDRLGRSLQHLLQIIGELKNKNVKFISITDGFDTTTPQGELFFSITGAFSQFERAIITERVNLGLDRARKQGKKLGRQKGSKDKSKRSRKGYFDRWAKEKKSKWHKNDKIAIVEGKEVGMSSMGVSINKYLEKEK